MPLTRFKLSSIADGGISTAKLADGAVTKIKTDSLFTNTEFDGQYIDVPVGTTAQRPSSPNNGFLRFNTDFGRLEQYLEAQSSWAAVDSPPIVTSIAYSGSLTAADTDGGETVTLTGSNFQSGAVVSVNGSACTTSYVNSTTVTFVTNAESAGDYDVSLQNSNGLTAILSNGISYNGTPAFSSPAAGNVGTFDSGKTISTITIVAAEPDGGTVAYSVTSGSLPSGLSLSSAGAITGTTGSTTGSPTTSTFTVTATDDENQTSTRTFNIQVYRPVFLYDIPYSMENAEPLGGSFKRSMPGSATDGTKGSVSMWIKPSWVGDTCEILTAADNTTDYWETYCDASRNLQIGQQGSRKTFATMQDTGWMHVFVAYDSTLSTATDRERVWINSVLQTPDTDAGQVAQNTVWNLTKSANQQTIGDWNGSSTLGDGTYTYVGLLSELHVVDGQALTPSSFGESYNSVWIPKEYTGTHGNNGFYFDADPDNVGVDKAGNGNFTEGNSAGNRFVAESPTNRYPKFTYLGIDPGVLHSDNTSSVSGNYVRLGQNSAQSDNNFVTDLQIPNEGKWYFECRFINQSNVYGEHGLINLSRSRFARNGYNNSWFGESDVTESDGGNALYYWTGNNSNGGLYGGSTGSDYNNQLRNNTTVAQTHYWAVDMDNGKAWWKSNTESSWYPSGDPAAGTGGHSLNNTDTDRWHIGTSWWNSTGAGTMHFNWGQDDTFGGIISTVGNTPSSGPGIFNGTVPTGFKSLHMDNFPKNAQVDHTRDGSKTPDNYFSVGTYTGTGAYDSTKSVTDVGFQPDIVMIKRQDSTFFPRLYWNMPATNYSGELAPLYVGHLKQIDGYAASETIIPTSTGFTIDQRDMGGSGAATGGINNSSSTHEYVAWKVNGGTTVANTDGDINSTVQVNDDLGISIVQYTGNLSSNSGAVSVGHGLSSAPKFIWFSSYNGGSDNVMHQNIMCFEGAYNGNDFGRITTPSDGWQDSSSIGGGSISAPTNSVFYTGYIYGMNYTGHNHMAICFSDVPGFCKSGIYHDNGNAEGPYVHLGFKPAFVLLKGNNTENFTHWTSATSTGKIWGTRQPWAASAASGQNHIIPTAQGFKVIAAGGESNSGGAISFLAFAEDMSHYSTSHK